MSDAAVLLDQIDEGQAEKETAINELADALSPSSFGGRRMSTCVGLTWGYYGGRWDGSVVPHGTINLPATSTSRIVADRATGEIILDTASDDLWSDTANYAHLYEITTGATEIDEADIADHRQGPAGLYGAAGSGGGGIGSVGLTVPAFLSVTGSPLTADGTLAVALSGTALPIANGGTGGTSQSAARTALGLAIGTNVQAYDADLAALAAIAGAQGDVIYHDGTSWVALGAGTAGQVLRTGGAGANPAWGNPVESIKFACSDETTPLTTGTAKITFRMPYAFTVTAVRASLTTAQPSGSILTIDINESGTSILSTKLTIDNTEKTSTTAATAAAISDTSLADDAEITVDIDQVGASGATGLKVYIIGRRT